MNSKKLAGIGIPILALIIVGSGDYGYIKKQTGADDNVTLAELRDNWDDYYIYFGMRSNRYADAIMFDPIYLLIIGSVLLESPKTYDIRYMLFWQSCDSGAG